MANQVIVYSATGWASCHQEKAWLSQKGIAFTDRNITEDEQARQDLEKLGFLSVPVTVVDGEVIPGFQPAKLEQVLWD